MIVQSVSSSLVGQEKHVARADIDDCIKNGGSHAVEASCSQNVEDCGTEQGDVESLG